jgi:hypothetical protein
LYSTKNYGNRERSRPKKNKIKEEREKERKKMGDVKERRK